MAVQIVPQTTSYNPFSPREVRAAIKSVTGLESAKSFTAETVAAFIPDGADPATWLKALRNVESAKPKPKAASAVAATSPAPGITTPNASPEPSFLLR
jgi:hypothetical protein